MGKRGDSVIGIDLGKHAFKAVSLRRKSDSRLVLTSFASREVPEIFDTPQALAEALAVACERFIAEEGAELKARYQAALPRFETALPQVHRGLVISGDQFVASAAAVAALRAQLPDALAVEMEGAAIAQVCHEYDVPCAVVRTISDTADEHASTSFSSFLTDIAGTYSTGILKRFLAGYRPLAR